MEVARCPSLIRRASPRQHERASGACHGHGHAWPALTAAAARSEVPRSRRSPNFLRHEQLAGVGSHDRRAWSHEHEPCLPVLVNALQILLVLAGKTSADVRVRLSAVSNFGGVCGPVNLSSSLPYLGALL